MMKKNSQIHIYVDTELLDRLKKEANSSGMSITELCRRKLIENLPLLKIETILEKIEKELSRRG